VNYSLLFDLRYNLVSAYFSVAMMQKLCYRITMHTNEMIHYSQFMK